MSTVLDEIITADPIEPAEEEEIKEDVKEEQKEEPKVTEVKTDQESERMPDPPKQLPIIVSEVIKPKPKPKPKPQFKPRSAKAGSSLVVLFLIFVIMLLIGGMIFLINYMINRPPVNTMAPVIYSTQMTGGEKLKGLSEERKQKRTAKKNNKKDKDK